MLTRPRVSIVIPVRNDAEALGRALDHLAGLERITGSEIIVAASGDPPRRDRTRRGGAGAGGAGPGGAGAQERAR